MMLGIQSFEILLNKLNLVFLKQTQRKVIIVNL